MRARLQSFLPGLNPKNGDIAYGGDHTAGKRKETRPFDSKQALHVVMRSSRAHGSWSMLHLKHCQNIHEFTHKLAERWGVRIYRYANVGNHIHLLIRARSRPVLQRYLRELAGGIAVIVTGARKSASLSKNKTGRGFWDHLLFSRIVYFGRDFKGVCVYLIKNLFEASGVPMKMLLAQGYRILSIADLADTS